MSFLKALLVFLALWVDVAQARLPEHLCAAFCERLAKYDERLSDQGVFANGETLEGCLGNIIAETFLDSGLAASMVLRDQVSYLVTPRNNDFVGFLPKRRCRSEEVEISFAHLVSDAWQHLQRHMPDWAQRIAGRYPDNQLARGVRNAELGQLLLDLLNRWSECNCDRNVIRHRLEMAARSEMWRLESLKIENAQRFRADFY